MTEPRPRGRPRMFTDHAQQHALFDTTTKRWWTLAAVAAAALVPFVAGRDATNLLTIVAIYAIGGIGLNLITGYAGQVSLGHAFFLGLGAYTAAVLGGTGASGVIGLGLDMWVWLPLAGLVPMLVGLAVAPMAARVRGLYLAMLTLGLVFVGEHIFKQARTFTGGAGVGRAGADPVLFGWELYRRQTVLGIPVHRETLFYLVCLGLLVVFAVAARNLARSPMGRAFAAVRDHDTAAEMTGVPLLRTKVLAFGVSSFYAGVAGGLLTVPLGQITPESWNLFLSVDFLAVILIGGIATISGSIMGAMFVVLLPRGVETLAHHVPFIGSTREGALLSVFQLETILFGLLIIAFLVLEPRGLYGLWLRARNYFKAWPFSY